MDCLSGGELFDKIIEKVEAGNSYREYETAKIIEQAILESIRVGTFKFKQKAWKSVSANAKDFIRKLLVKNPINRLSAG